MLFFREMGALWKSPNRWIKVSYSFFHGNRSRAPIPFISGLRDFNAPIAGSGQMYRALKFLGLCPHQLVIYTGQYHCIKLPCDRRDIQELYLAQFLKYFRHWK